MIEHRWVGADEKDGNLRSYHADKAVTSAGDAKRWKDLTPPPGYVADIHRFIADPDHAGRAFFVATVIRGVIYRPKDDRYSEYDVIREASPEGQRLLERGAALVKN